MSGQDGQSEILCVGEMLWDMYVPAGTPLTDANHVSFELGGSATNVARHLAKLGVRAGVLGAVGEDALGTAYLERLARERVGIDKVLRFKGRTGLVLISNDPPVAVSYRAADEEALAFRQLLNKGDFGCKILHFSSLLPDRQAIHTLAKAAKRARHAGVIVSVDANLRPRLWRGDAVVKANPYELLDVADVVKVSREDLNVLGIDEMEELRDRLRFDSILFLTDGDRPTRAWGSLGLVEVDVKKLDVPTAIGAGDAFVAGSLSAMLEMHPRMWPMKSELKEIVGHGNAIARSSLEDRAMRGTLR